MTAPSGVHDFDELVNQQVRNKGLGNSDIGLISGDLMEFQGGNGDISGFTFGDDEYGDDTVNVPHGISGKESTGRWTREEHLAFIKGLELYGKGWKKIAGLIKSRTVVQIRTHAQKYFLKLSKARQNGDHHMAKALSGRPGSGGGLGEGGGGASAVHRNNKHRVKKSERPLALCPAVRQYFQPSSGTGMSDRTSSRGSSPTGSCTGSLDGTNGVGSDDSGGEQPHHDGMDTTSTSTHSSGGGGGGGESTVDVESGIYNFLSPVLNHDDGNTTSDSSSVHSDHSSTNGVNLANSMPPAWYIRCAQLSNLLREAETLDWAADRGVPAVESMSTLATNSNTSSPSSSSAGMPMPQSQQSSAEATFQPLNLAAADTGAAASSSSNSSAMINNNNFNIKVESPIAMQQLVGLGSPPQPQQPVAFTEQLALMQRQVEELREEARLSIV